jgi:hypothetical protein
VGGVQPDLDDRLVRDGARHARLRRQRRSARRAKARAGNDPWLGDTLEWYTTSPPPPHNFDMFAIVFFWTPPHFWALSLLMKDEYAKVGVPMLPVVRGEARDAPPDPALHVLLYAVTQLPFCAGGFGAIYLVASLGARRPSSAGAVRLLRRADRRAALRTVPLLARLPRAAVRRDGPRRQALDSAPLMDRRSPARTSAPASSRPRHALHVRDDLRRGAPLRLDEPARPRAPARRRGDPPPGPSLKPFLMSLSITHPSWA